MEKTRKAARPLGFGGVGERVRLVAVDADDTLWDCQGHFERVERELCALLSKYAPAVEVARELARVERSNVPLTGYGATAFTLSMVEAAVGVSGGRVGGAEIERILGLGRRLMELPAEPLPGVEDTLRRLRGAGPTPRASRWRRRRSSAARGCSGGWTRWSWWATRRWGRRAGCAAASVSARTSC